VLLIQFLLIVFSVILRITSLNWIRPVFLAPNNVHEPENREKNALKLS